MRYQSQSVIYRHWPVSYTFCYSFSVYIGIWSNWFPFYKIFLPSMPSLFFAARNRSLTQMYFASFKMSNGNMEKGRLKLYRNLWLWHIFLHDKYSVGMHHSFIKTECYRQSIFRLSCKFVCDGMPLFSTLSNKAKQACEITAEKV